jgi:Flp pilus assembly pilin Flp
MKFLLKHNRDEGGTALAEQTIVLAFVATIAVSSFTALGNRINLAVSKATTAIPSFSSMTGQSDGERSD